MAKSLEEALRKRSESEPQTPVGVSVRALGLAHQAKLESSLSTDRGNLETEGKMVRSQLQTKHTAYSVKQLSSICYYLLQESQLVEKLQGELKQKETDLAKLEEEMKQLKAMQPAVKEATTASSLKSDTAAILNEERLRWQMEKENLRKELTAKMDAEKEPIIKEKEALENRLKLVEETSPSLTKEQVVALENSLTETQSRLVLGTEIGHVAEKYAE